MRWFARPITSTDVHGPAPLLRRRFALDRPLAELVRARLHVSAWGIVQTYLNGQAVAEDLFEPGWSSYQWRLRYRTYEVGHLLAETSTLAAVVGNGWYRGRLGVSGDPEVYGPRRALIAQLELEFADGHEQVIASDASWQWAPSGVLEDDLYDGQTTDRRLPGAREASANTDGCHWEPVVLLEGDLSVLEPATAPPVRRTEVVDPVSVERRSPDRVLVDFGQNLVGWVRLTVQGKAGQEIVLRHSEVLEDGELAVRPLRSARATDRFLLSGDPDVLEPTLTFHGFRYAEIIGFPGEPGPGSIQAVVVHTDLPRTGHFRCSDDLLNRFHDNVVWSARGNFLGLPTDCPQRDERLGWTGDISAFAPTAAYLFDVRTFLGDWLTDLALEQRAQGGWVPNIVPNLFALTEPPGSQVFTATAVWGDAAVWVPWALWQAYGERDLLARQLPSMLMHVRHVLGLRSDNGLVDSTREYGDWLDPDAPPEAPWQAKVDKGLVATACLYRSCTLTAEAAQLLGHEHEAEELRAAATDVRDAFRRHYLGADGRVAGDAVTGYALAIVFGLIDDAELDLCGAELARLVTAADYRITTGFAGTPFVCDALVRCGRLDLAYRLLMQKEAPSWLYPVTLGATTIWERWDSLLPDGSVNPGEMTSFNHYALGAVADWVHRVVGGIAPLAPGYEHVLIAPRPGGGLTFAEASLDTQFGRIAVSWSTSDDLMTTTVDIPPGVTARVAPGGAEPRELAAGRHVVTGPA